jgi:hypothetical protein
LKNNRFRYPFTKNFGEQFLAAILELLPEIFSGRTLGTIFQVVESSCSSGAPWGTNFGEQISGTILGSSFVNSFLEQLWGAIMCGAISDDIFWE